MESPEALRIFVDFHSVFLAMQAWYALLYVVIEGYQELDSEDARIDVLLANEDYVDALRRFRNSVFHFQKEPLNEKLLGFISVPESENWIRDLNTAFQEYFEAIFPSEKMTELLNTEAEWPT